MVDAYYFCVGGSVGQFASIARPVGYRCAATDVPDAIERLLNAFKDGRDGAETLRAFLARHTLKNCERFSPMIWSELWLAICRRQACRTAWRADQ